MHAGMLAMLAMFHLGGGAGGGIYDKPDMSTFFGGMKRRLSLFCCFGVLFPALRIAFWDASQTRYR